MLCIKRKHFLLDITPLFAFLELQKTTIIQDFVNFLASFLSVVVNVILDSTVFFGVPPLADITPCSSVLFFLSLFRPIYDTFITFCLFYTLCKDHIDIYDVSVATGDVKIIQKC